MCFIHEVNKIKLKNDPVEVTGMQVFGAVFWEKYFLKYFL